MTSVDAVRNGTGKVELRTRVESNETELVLVPTDGTEPLGWRGREPPEHTPARAGGAARSEDDSANRVKTFATS